MPKKAWSERDEPPIVFVAGVLEVAGLKPIDPPTVIGFNSVDELIDALPKTLPAGFDAQWNAALLNTPVDEQVVEYDDVSDSEDPEYWTPDADPTS